MCKLLRESEGVSSEGVSVKAINMSPQAWIGKEEEYESYATLFIIL